MKKLLAIYFLFILCEAIAQPDTILYQKQASANNVLAAKLQSVKGEKQYITAELIRIQGITRLSELIPWIDKATYNTTDWNSFYLNINGTGTSQHQEYILMINAQKVELEKWDAISLDGLGIAVTNIAYVEIINTPQIINGQFVGKGAINIVMRNDLKGLTFSGYQNYGNPIGDPGPAQYITNYSSPNIHKTGLVYAYSAGYFAKKWHVNISRNHSDWLLRSQDIIDRISAYDSTTEKNSFASTRLEAALGLNKYLIEAGGAISNQDGYVYRNFFQTEIPLSSSYHEGRLRITRSLNNKKYIRANLIINQSKYNYADTGFIDYSYHTANGNIEYGNNYIWKGILFKQLSGYAVDYASYNNGNTFQLRHKPYTTLEYNINKKVKQRIDVSMVVLNNTINPLMAFKYEKFNSILTSWSVIASYQQTRLNQNYDQFWYFYNTGRQYALPGYISKLNSTPTQFFSADYFYYLTSSTNFKLTLNPGIRYQYNHHFIQFDAVSGTPLVIDNGSAGTASFYTLTFGANVHYDVFNDFWFDIDYFSANEKSSNANLQSVLNNDSRRKLLFSFYYKLPARIDIGIRWQAVSKTQWQLYNNAGQLINYSVPASYVADISFNKKMWGDRIMLNTGIKNLFNQYAQVHPLGADFQMRFYATVTVKFGDTLKYLPKK